MTSKVRVEKAKDPSTKFVVEVWNPGSPAVPGKEASGDHPAVPAQPEVNPFLVREIALDYPDAYLIVKEA
jgi:hypothetical protein